MWCFIHRWRTATAIDSGRALPEGAERHLADCAACRAEWETGKALTDRLAVGVREGGGVPEGLHGRMMAAIRREVPVSDPVASGWRIWVPLGSVALGLLLAAGMIALFAGVKIGNVSVGSIEGAGDSSPLGQVSGLAPAVATLAAATGQTLADPLAPEWATIEQTASAAAQTVIAAVFDRLPGMN